MSIPKVHKTLEICHTVGSTEWVVYMGNYGKDDAVSRVDTFRSVIENFQKERYALQDDGDVVTPYNIKVTGDVSSNITGRVPG